MADARAQGCYCGTVTHHGFEVAGVHRTRDSATVNKHHTAPMTERERRFRNEPVHADEPVGSSGEGGTHALEHDSPGACLCAACRRRRTGVRALDADSPIHSVADINAAHRRAFGRM